MPKSFPGLPGSEHQLIEAVPTTALADALDPEKLSPLAEAAVRELLTEGESENTRRSYRTAMRYWEAWFACRYQKPMTLPVPIPTALQFIVDHAVRAIKDPVTKEDRLVCELPPDVELRLIETGFKKEPGPLSLSTLMLRMSVLSKLHQLKEVPNPCLSIKVREALSKTRRAYAKRGDKPKKKAALTIDPLTAMLATCDESPTGVRDRALLMVAWASGGRRRSEVVQASLENVNKVGDRQYVFTLDQTKTDQDGTDDQDKPVVDDAADALEAWLALLKEKEILKGPIFRRIRRWGAIGEPLAPAAVRDIVIRRAKLAGVKGDFSAHSLRSGFVTEAARGGVPLGETMAMTGHTTVGSIVGYFRTEEVVKSKGARLLRVSKPPSET